MRLYRSTLFGVGAILVGLLATSCDALHERGYEPSYVSRATAEDCAVIVEVAKVMVGPNVKGLPIEPTHQLTDGGQFKENCAWKRLGVGNPRDPKPGEQSFVIYKPIYRGDTAQVTVDIIGSPKGDFRPLVTGYASCQLKRTGATWAVERCARSPRAG